MTSTAIEASSLSPLTTLAANPPLRPQSVQLQPLVLYIARVPGSRDVFLSPLKPRQKVVTAEDIESCLYYLHVSGPEDEILLETTVWDEPLVEDLPPDLPARPRPNEQNSLPQALRAGQRDLSHHPLPPIPPYPLEDGPPRFDTYVLPEEFRKPSPAIPHRKPVGQQREQLGSSDVNTPPALPARPNASVRPSLASTAPQPEFEPQITVIRRSPVTGEQWNVGTIADPPVFDIASDGRRSSMTSTRIRKSGQPLYLSISNPGYTKFLREDERTRPASPASSTPSLSFSNGTSESSNAEPLFKRRMWLEGSLFEKKAAGHRKSVSADHTEQPSLPPRPSFNSNNSDFTRRPTDSADPDSFLGPQDLRRLSLSTGQKRSFIKGYTFLSPWEGRCEFSSGTMGNSLKCRHLRQRKSVSYEANVPSQVSELRFNLPGGGPLASEPRQRSPPKSKEKESRRARLRAKFSDHHHHHSSSQDIITQSEISLPSENSEDTRMGISLGQELAGGGFAGKQAKLGKLIIEGEGLAMLDLLVAANMALWFRAYEKHQSGS